MRKWPAVSILVILAALFSGGVWLFYTPSGARILVYSISRMVPARMSFGAVEGAFAQTLTIHDLIVSVPQVFLSISVRSLVLSCRPARLLDGTVAVDRLLLEDVTVADDRQRTKEPFRFAWPHLSHFGTGTRGWVRELRIENARYRRLGEIVLPFDRVQAHVSWHDGILGLQDLAVEGPSFSGAGTIDAGFLKPLLKADVTIDPRRPLAGVARLMGKFELGRGRSIEELAGPLSAKAVLPKGTQMTLGSRVEILKDKIDFQGFRLAHATVSGNMTGEASLIFGPDKPSIRLNGHVKDLRRKEGTGKTVVVTGDIRIEGMPDGYEGTFAASGRVTESTSKPWLSAQAAGLIKGSLEGCEVTLSSARWLGGNVTGGLKVSWQQQTLIEAAVSGRGLDPAYFNADWTGVVNTNADLHITGTPTSGFKGTVRATFPESTLRGKALTGEFTANFGQGRYQVETLKLQGRGFDVRASGVLEEKLLFDVAVTDMGGLIPTTGGSLLANGWLQWKAGELNGTVSGRGKNIVLGDGKIGGARFSGQLGVSGPQRINLDVLAEGAAYGDLRADKASLSVVGTKNNHVAEGTASVYNTDIHISLQGGQTDNSWSGMITGLYGGDTRGKWTLASPARLAFSPDQLQVGTLQLTSQKKESLTVEGDISFHPLRGALNGRWNGVDLARMEHILSARSAGREDPSPTGGKKAIRSVSAITGTTSGNLSIRWPEGTGRSIDGQATVAAHYKQNSLELPLSGVMQAHWKETGLAAGWEMALKTGETISGTISAGGPPAFKLPETASVSAGWKEIDVAHFSHWLPADLSLKGRLSGTIEGAILPGGVVNLTGQTAINQGSAGWRPGNGVVTASIQNGSARFMWAGTSLQGEVSLALAKYGKVEGNFSLPLPAHLPPAFTPNGPLILTVKGQVREQGLIAALFPNAVHETKGILDLDAAADGTWQNPNFRGGITLKDASASIPAAGIKIERVQGRASLMGESLRVQVRAESGGGWLEATGDVRMDKGRTLRYQGTVKGESFQLLNLTDVRAFVSPAITLQGDRKLLSARGDIAVPRMSIYGRQGDVVVRQSPDIAVVDAPAKKKRTSPIGLDIKVRVVLGDKVLVEGQGFDARLTGALDVEAAGIDQISTRGRIRIVEGGYKAYGIRLVVTRGNINFVGPVDRPTLDILATKKSEDVTAGVQITGTARTPTVGLYSSPPLPDADKLSYIILGHRLATASSSEASSIAGVAGVFEGGATPTMTSEARKKLGLGGPPGTTPQEEAARSMVSVGKYLTPTFYVGIGRSLLRNENLLTLRYNLSENWEIESRLGGETGADIFYRIEFD